MSDSSVGAPPALPLLCFVVGIIVFLVGGAVGPSVAGGGPTGPFDGDTGPPGVQDARDPAQSTAGTWSIETHNETTEISTNTTFVIELEADGTARWTIIEYFNTTSQSQRSAFDQLASSFVSEDVGGSTLGFDAFESASARVNAITDREMALVNAQRTSSRNASVGQLQLSFTWENFARVEDGDIILDDVYETEQGIWFDGLGPGQRLTIKSPDGYGFAEFSVSESTTLEDRQLKLAGPATFNNETLYAVLVGNAGTTDSSPTEPTPSEGDDGLVGTVGLLLGGVGALGAVIVLIVFAIGRDRVGELIESDGEAESDDDNAIESSNSEPDVPPEPEAETDEMDEESEIDTELLSDEERVERLLEQKGGRMKQANIVKETGWSNAKVSQLLSSMEQEGRIDKLRIGRENLISFPDEDVTEIGDK